MTATGRRLKTDGDDRSVNVATLERVGSGALGVLLAVRGLRRASVGGTALALTGGAVLYRAITGHSYVYESLGINTAEKRGRSSELRVQQSITINKPAEELYRAWRDPQTLAAVMGHFAELSPSGEGRMRWAMNNPLGSKLEWQTEVIEDRPGERLRWRSVPGSAWPNEGRVDFVPGASEWGSIVRLSLQFNPPGGQVSGALLRRINFVPRMIAHKALQRFKSLMETGEIPTLQNNPTARSGAMANAF